MRLRRLRRTVPRILQDIGLVQSAGWTGIALYGDPTPTILQRLSPSETGAGRVFVTR